jgi:hypothetical protein
MSAWSSLPPRPGKRFWLANQGCGVARLARSAERAEGWTFVNEDSNDTRGIRAQLAGATTSLSVPTVRRYSRTIRPDRTAAGRVVTALRTA